MENADINKKYHFFVLHRDITEINMVVLKGQLIPFSQFSLDFINITQYIKNYDFFTGEHEGLTIESYFRLLVPELFSTAGYDKVIYLDGDMICCTDIAELFEIDVGQCLLASSRDIMGIGCYYSGAYEQSKEKDTDGKFIVKRIDDYFIAGMIVFNTKEFSKTIPLKNLLDFAVSRKWRCHDQDVLNVLCEDGKFLLPMKWDFVEEENIELYAPEYIQKEYYDAKDKPKIIHFCKNKPWKIFFYGCNFHLFWKYASRTPFINVIIERMRNENLITSTTYTNHILPDIKSGKGPGTRYLIKCLLHSVLK
jgi:lipopolysaccharide biosynthesis glycosyltransferase